MTRINLDFSENCAKKITKIINTQLKTHGVDTSHTVYIAHIHTALSTHTHTALQVRHTHSHTV